MAKRKFKKLTDTVRKKIKDGKLKKSDLNGDALTYYKRRQAAKKKKKEKENKVAKIDELVIPEDSEIYRIVKESARINKMTVKQFVKKHRKDIEDLMKEGDIIQNRETEYLIEDIQHLAKGKKVFVNDGNGYRHVGKNSDILAIQVFTQHVMGVTDIFMIIYRVHYKLNGDLTHYLPPPEEYEELEDIDMEHLLDEYYPDITYLKSRKDRAKKEKEKRIHPYSKKRKKQTKANPIKRPKRKANDKLSKKG